MKYQVGMRVTGVINNITDLGLFISLPHRAHGLIHHSDFAGNWDRERRRLAAGDKIRVVVLHNYRGKLSLSVARLNDPDLVDPDNQFKDLSAAKFDKVLSQTADAGKKEIVKLENILEKF